MEYLRVLGGKDATIQQYPYLGRLEVVISFIQMAQMRETGLHTCTCSILKPTWTLAAAHCFGDLITLRKTEKNLTIKPCIRYGDVTDFKNKTSEVIKYIIHPGYRMYAQKMGFQAIHNDIGLMQTEPIMITKYAKVSAIDYRTLIGEEAVATGFGLTNEGKKINSTLNLRKPLQILNVIVIKCDSEENYPVLCIASKCGDKAAAMCAGDSGGPLIHSSGVIAVHSFGVSSACIPSRLRVREAFSIGGVTAVSPYLNWIKDIVG